MQQGAPSAEKGYTHTGTGGERMMRVAGRHVHGPYRSRPSARAGDRKNGKVLDLSTGLATVIVTRGRAERA